MHQATLGLGRRLMVNRPISFNSFGFLQKSVVSSNRIDQLRFFSNHTTQSHGSSDENLGVKDSFDALNHQLGAIFKDAYHDVVDELGDSNGCIDQSWNLIQAAQPKRQSHMMKPYHEQGCELLPIQSYDVSSRIKEYDDSTRGSWYQSTLGDIPLFSKHLESGDHVYLKSVFSFSDVRVLSDELRKEKKQIHLVVSDIEASRTAVEFGIQDILGDIGDDGPFLTLSPYIFKKDDRGDWYDEHCLPYHNQINKVLWVNSMHLLTERDLLYSLGGISNMMVNDKASYLFAGSANVNEPTNLGVPFHRVHELMKPIVRRRIFEDYPKIRVLSDYLYSERKNRSSFDIRAHRALPAAPHFSEMKKTFSSFFEEVSDSSRTLVLERDDTEAFFVNRSIGISYFIPELHQHLTRVNRVVK